MGVGPIKKQWPHTGKMVVVQQMQDGGEDLGEGTHSNSVGGDEGGEGNRSHTQAQSCLVWGLVFVLIVKEKPGWKMTRIKKGVT